MPTNTYVALATQTLGASATTISLTSIPSGYTDLVLVLRGVYNTNNYINMKLNNDSTSTYSMTYLRGDGSSASSGRASNASYGIGFTAGNPDNAIFELQNYSNTTTNKTVLIRTNASTSETRATVGLWRSTAAINQIDLIHDSANGFASGTTVSLYGVAAASIGAKATGGTIYSDSSYYYHVFSGNGTFTPTQSISADVLVVAGGGSGGGRHAGGGGAGGLQAFASQSLTATNYTVTVGAGGVATGTSGRGTSGSNSQFGALAASIGGGAGGSGGGSNSSLTGGSGGAGGASAAMEGGTGSAGTAGQGYAGGNGSGYAGTSYYAGGGGGGAGGAGQSLTDTANSPGGFGGVGATSSFIQAIGLASGIGQNVSGTYYLAGGGGGGNWSSSTGIQGVGGYGGGGNGGKTDPSNAIAGTANTGGGGGGGGLTSGGGTGVGGNGGSGVIIVRYAK